VPPVAWLCDFDGTVSPNDIGAAFAERFSPDGVAERLPEIAEWRAGRLGHRALTEAQCAAMRASREEALEFTRGFALDPAFAPFVREVQGRGEHVMVVSEGFDFYVKDQLERAGLGDVPWAANALEFRPDGRLVPSFPHADPACDRCGNCKAAHVRLFQARDFHVVLVGDGDSDRHGAMAADQVLARRTLLEWCRTVGLAHFEVRDFADIAAWARSGAIGARQAATGGGA
jgi:2,3-diketo-5-methylthio-1-phosphopentane phosphatase